ncbi:enoyl-CoA hydratase/isomerase family protein [Halomicroarcula sp. GCM10025324]|uniref:enoyl-CoA hydratase/isomerase family protein n=1 Tax=Haloarcula TaxID=2237 RepID=UPI0023E8F90C|nr:enoyl-CoA hydratase/isomerase family protein [Halomicroarcula sp. ZS-22-S1]
MSTETEFEYIDFSVENDVTTVRLQRPEKKNAITGAMREELVEAFERFDDGVGTVLVLTGSGDSFSAGTDINELEDRLPETVTEAVTLDQFALPERIEALDKPTIALLNGLTLGGGFELALACDIRIASEEASLGFPEISIGGFPGEGGTQRLPRETNLGTALLMLLTGEFISAEEAKAHGIVQEVHPPDSVEERTMEIAEAIAEKDELALVLAKLSTKMAAKTEFQQGLELEGILANVIEATPERKERLSEFLDR